MPTIRIDDEVWRALRKMATAFEDTPNSVLRQLLRLDKNNKPRTSASRAAKGEKTPREAYRMPILQALYELGGTGKTSDVLDRVEALMCNVLKPVDHQPLACGAIRWRNTAQWERNAMVQQGLLKKESPRGIWELTAKGIAAVESFLADGGHTPSSKVSQAD